MCCDWKQNEIEKQFSTPFFLLSDAIFISEFLSTYVSCEVFLDYLLLLTIIPCWIIVQKLNQTRSRFSLYLSLSYSNSIRIKKHCNNINLNKSNSFLKCDARIRHHKDPMNVRKEMGIWVDRNFRRIVSLEILLLYDTIKETAKKKKQWIKIIHSNSLQYSLIYYYWWKLKYKKRT